VLIELGSLPIHSLILHVPFILVTSKLFMPSVRAKSRLKLIKVLQKKDKLKSTFNMKDLGPIHWFLGLEITRD